MYTPLQIKPGRSREREAITFTPSSGEDLLDIPQLLAPERAERIVNYIPLSEGRLRKRRGQQQSFTVAGTTTGGSMLEKYTDDVYIIGYAQTVAARRLSTAATTNIKTDFIAGGTFSGARYGDYFFVANGRDRIWRISQTLNYDAQTANYNVGATLVGATSGARAVILQDTDAGATGTLTLGSITGTFQNNEIIADNGAAPGSATADGVVGFTITEVTAAPRAQVIKAIDSRLYAGVQDAIQYSASDDGTNPPFTNWTVATTATAAGRVSYRNGSTVTSIEALGENIVVFADEGKWAFRIDQIDSGGTLSKVDVPVMFRQDFGGTGRSLSCKKGLFYVNETGLWQLVAVGSQNIPFSDQEALTSILLGTSFFEDLTMTNIDLVYDGRQDLLLMSAARDSATNNFVLGYSFRKKAFFEISGWNINRWLNDLGTIYSMRSTSVTVDQCFINTSDNGANIGTDYLQELNLGAPETRKFLMGAYFQGFLSPSTTINVDFDIYDVTGRRINDKKRYTWTTQYNNNVANGWDQAQWDEASFDGDSDLAQTVESFDGCRPYIRNLQRLKIHLTSNDRLNHEVNWIKAIAREKVPIRRRRMVDIT